MGTPYLFAMVVVVLLVVPIIGVIVDQAAERTRPVVTDPDSRY
ncbi:MULTISPECIES: hypothetical protein [unclassified Kitasatospora]